MRSRAQEIWTIAVSAPPSRAAGYWRLSACTASGSRRCPIPSSVSSALELSSRTEIAVAPRSAARTASRPRAPAIPTEFSTVTAPALRG